MVVWDSVYAGVGQEVRHVCYTVDSMPRLYTVVMQNHISDMIRCTFGTIVARLGNAITVGEIRVESGGMECVSFVARATLYLSMIINPVKRQDMIREMSHYERGNQLEAFIYRCFEDHLFDLINVNTPHGNIVLFKPENMYNYYINYLDFGLIVQVWDPSTGEYDIRPVQYQGVEIGFEIL